MNARDNVLGEPIEASVMDGYTVVVTVEDFDGLASTWWHAWDGSGSYAGQSNNRAWLALLIARHAHR